MKTYRKLIDNVKVDTYIGHVSFFDETSLPDRFFNALDLVLISLAIFHGALLGLFKCHLQRLNSFHGRLQALLQLGQLTSQVGIVAHQL